MPAASMTSGAFSSLPRVYGTRTAALLPTLRVCIVGLGGVGSWAAEAMVRTGIGHVTIIDHDDVSLSNVNRQLQAFQDNLGESKVEAMRARLLRISPECDVVAEDDFLAEKNLEHYLLRDFDVVIDAIDSIRFKAAMIAFCHRRKIRIVTTGGAGGRTDPLAVTVDDLSRTEGDALAAKVRQRLRGDYNFSSNPRRRFGVDCVYSREQPVYPDGDGEITHSRPGVPGARLDCDRGYGSVVFVTANVGFVAASVALRRALARRERAGRSGSC